MLRSGRPFSRKGIAVRLFIGNLPFSATEEDIHGMFAAVGVTAESITIMRDKFSGKSRGFGFADVADNAQGEMAVTACNGKPLMGRPLVVNEARPTNNGGGGSYRRDRY